MSNRKEYEKQKKIWYDKLKKEGFKDIEPHENTLKEWSYQFKRYYNTPDLFQAKADYYYEAGHFLNSHKFRTELEKAIWEYHSNGISIRDIARTLKKAGQKADHNSVWAVVSRLRNIMRGF